jgi:hypothetical protein
MRAERTMGAITMALAGMMAVGCAREPEPAPPPSPIPAQQFLPIVLEPDFADRTATPTGCSIPILIEDESTNGFQRLSLVAQALDQNGKFLEESRFDAQREPMIDQTYYDTRMQFSKPTCRAMRSVVITSASCTGDNGMPGSCFNRLNLQDRSGGRLRFRLR